MLSLSLAHPALATQMEEADHYQFTTLSERIVNNTMSSRRKHEECVICEERGTTSKTPLVDCISCNEVVCKSHAGRKARVKGMSKEAPKQRMCDDCYDGIRSRAASKHREEKRKKSALRHRSKEQLTNISKEDLEVSQGKMTHGDIMERFNSQNSTASGTTEDTASYYSFDSKSSSKSYRKQRSQMISAASFNEADEEDAARHEAKLAKLKKTASKLKSDNEKLERKLQKVETLKSKHRSNLQQLFDKKETLEGANSQKSGEDELEIQNGGVGARYRVRGKQALRKGRHLAALAEFRRAVKVTSDDSMSYYYMAKAFLGLNKLEEAHEAAYMSFDLNANHKSCVLIGHICRELGEVEEALEMYQKAIDLKESSPDSASRKQKNLHENETTESYLMKRKLASSRGAFSRQNSADSLEPKWS